MEALEQGKELTASLSAFPHTHTRQAPPPQSVFLFVHGSASFRASCVPLRNAMAFRHPSLALYARDVLVCVSSIACCLVVVGLNITPSSRDLVSSISCHNRQQTSACREFMSQAPQACGHETVLAVAIGIRIVICDGCSLLLPAGCAPARRPHFAHAFIPRRACAHLSIPPPRQRQETQRLSEVHRKAQLWRGIVSISLIEGRDLVPMDPNGLSDPYAKFRLGPQKYKSKVPTDTPDASQQEQATMRRPGLLDF